MPYDAAERARHRSIALDTLDLSRVATDAAVWEKVVLKLRAGVMPPAGAPRPDKATHEAFAS